MSKTQTEVYYSAIHDRGGSTFADNLGIVLDCVKRYKDLPEYVREDLIQEGAMALWRVIEGYPGCNKVWYRRVRDRMWKVAQRKIKEKKMKIIDIDSLEI